MAWRRWRLLCNRRRARIGCRLSNTGSPSSFELCRRSRDNISLSRQQSMPDSPGLILICRANMHCGSGRTATWSRWTAQWSKDLRQSSPWNRSTELSCPASFPSPSGRARLPFLCGPFAAPSCRAPSLLASFRGPCRAPTEWAWSAGSVHSADSEYPESAAAQTQLRTRPRSLRGRKLPQGFFDR